MIISLKQKKKKKNIQYNVEIIAYNKARNNNK